MRKRTAATLTILLLALSFAATAALSQEAQAAPAANDPLSEKELILPLTTQEKRDVQALAFLIANYATLHRDRQSLHALDPKHYPSDAKKLGKVLPDITPLLALPDQHIQVWLADKKVCSPFWKEGERSRWQELLKAQNPTLDNLPPVSRQPLIICIFAGPNPVFSTSILVSTSGAQPRVGIFFSRGFYTTTIIQGLPDNRSRDLFEEWQESGLDFESPAWAELNGRYILTSKTLAGAAFLLRGDNLSAIYGCLVGRDTDDKKCADFLWDWELCEVKAMVDVAYALPILYRTSGYEIRQSEFLPNMLHLFIGHNGRDAGAKYFVRYALPIRYPELEDRYGKFWEQK
jgi:hypothetical protein